MPEDFEFDDMLDDTFLNDDKSILEDDYGEGCDQYSAEDEMFEDLDLEDDDFTSELDVLFDDLEFEQDEFEETFL